MALGGFFGKPKLTPQEKAAKIKAKYEAKRKEQGLFTENQEELMAELGLMATGASARQDVDREDVDREDKEKKRAASPGRQPKKRDPLTKRQRQLMIELGLTSQKPEDPKS